MTKTLKNFIVLTVLSSGALSVFSQENNFQQISQTEKKKIDFPLDYKIARPRLQFPHWDDDFDTYYKFLTPTIRKTQASLSSNNNGVISTFTPNSIIPHAQLDTLTTVQDPQKLAGTWRMLKFRSISFNDSVYVPTKMYYRLPDSLLDDKSNDEAFATITDNNIKLYVKESGKTEFKKMMSAKYKIENRRFLLMYKLAKSGGGVSQFGIDENGYLILNYPRVIENIKKGEYISYYAIIEQYIFEKVN